jgi:hypothetical protein
VAGVLKPGGQSIFDVCKVVVGSEACEAEHSRGEIHVMKHFGTFLIRRRESAGGLP